MRVLARIAPWPGRARQDQRCDRHVVSHYFQRDLRQRLEPLRLPDEVTRGFTAGVRTAVATQPRQQHAVVEPTHPPRTAVVVDLVDHTVDHGLATAEGGHLVHEGQAVEATLRLDRGANLVQRTYAHGIADQVAMTERGRCQPATPSAPGRHAALRRPAPPSAARCIEGRGQGSPASSRAWRATAMQPPAHGRAVDDAGHVQSHCDRGASPPG